MKLDQKTLLALLGISTIVVIGALHALWFGPRAAELAKVEANLAASITEGQNVRLLRNPSQLVEYKAETQEIETAFDDVISTLGLEKEDVWQLPTLKSVEFEPPEGASPELGKQLRQENFERELEKTIDQQLDLVFEQLRRLQQFDPDHPQSANRDTEMTFIENWQLPIELPEEARGALLQDILREAKGTLDFIEIIGEDQVGLRNEQRRIYYNTIGKIGIRNELYRGNAPRSLTWYGEFVPLAHKLMIAMLVEEELQKTSSTTFQTYDREELYKMLDFRLPTEPLYIEDKPANVNDLYFMYVSLKFLNSALELAVENDVAEVTEVLFGEVAYVASTGGEALPWYNGKEVPQRKVPEPSPYVQEASADADVKRNISPPKKTEIGYAVPLYLQFRASNLNGWNFIYSVLRDHKMTELDKISINAPPANDNDQTELSWQVKFIQVPTLLISDGPAEEEAAPIQLTGTLEDRIKQGMLLMAKQQQALLEAAKAKEGAKAEE